MGVKRRIQDFISSLFDYEDGPGPAKRTATGVEEPPKDEPVTQDLPKMGIESANQALNTMEILEMILVQTDMRTLLVSAQRVCHKWADLIAHSPSIQKTLFFTPIQESEWGTGIQIFNPILTKTINSSFPFNNEPDNWQDFRLSAFMMTKDHSGVAAFTRKNASWRKMLVQQPPTPGIGILDTASSRGGTSARFSHILADQEMEESGQNWLLDGNKRISNEFSRMLDEFGLILHISRIIQCVRGARVHPTHEDSLQRQALQDYVKQGFNLCNTGKKIEESLSKHTIIRAPRWEQDSEEDEDEDDDDDGVRK
ncbi:hypothetical protein N7466_010974 [Penicillium verhagenii]|uniref:uncharacterized protein n=1 Tax=Penicillium verhagenii TaxID=1562060 RepID=UPI0025459073|nr:uncharacterized protein N7466_010974 [Penicillium verhagenii]KAJ5917420.1 hypothetical protein N7466_010974 [Penicillium verhagenii]